MSSSSWTGGLGGHLGAAGRRDYGMDHGLDALVVEAQLLVIERGWSPRRYGRRVAGALIAAFIA